MKQSDTKCHCEERSDVAISLVSFEIALLPRQRRVKLAMTLRGTLVHYFFSCYA
jgi:hypothetical protein